MAFDVTFWLTVVQADHSQRWDPLHTDPQDHALELP